jgi:hypothetical protein
MQQAPREQEYTDQELLGMRPAVEADHEAWRAYHKLLFDHGKLNPSPER